MTKRAIFIYWLLLLLPTAFITTAAYKLLRHEQARINQEARLSARDRVQAIGDTLQVTVEAVEDELTTTLKAIPGNALIDSLTQWESQNPLIRNAFIWDPVRGLIKPEPGITATADERYFMARYDALISGRVPWEAAAMDATMPSKLDDTAQTITSRSQAPTDGRQSSPLMRSYRRFQSGRQKLMEMARGQPAESPRETLDADMDKQPQSGWIPWFSDNSLYLLGWIQPTPDGIIYGVDLEVMTLLSRLILDFPAADSIPQGMVYALVDGNGKLLHQAGQTPIQSGRRPDIGISLSPQLPHWQVAVFFTDDNASQNAGRRFFLLSGLLLLIFSVAILIGGALLTRQAFRNFKDACQKTSFVSNVSHELKTPLTSIRMYAELLNENRIKSPGKKKQYLQVIVNESQRLTRLVNNVLDFSRLEQGRKKYRIEELDLVEFLQSLFVAHRLQFEQVGIIPKLELPEYRLTARTDRDAAEQVLLNLLDNALKYAADGEELVVALDRQERLGRIRVMDRGPGVSAAHRSKIFDKFHRVDDSLTTVKTGSGLGLSIARRLLRDLDGDLRFESRPGGGSCFVVLIPLVHST